MKFSIEPYKLFNKKDVVNFIKHNMNGSFTWKGYVSKNKPDHKFGYNKFDYFLQIPLIGALGLGCGVIVFTPVIYFGIFMQQVKENEDE